MNGLLLRDGIEEALNVRVGLVIVPAENSSSEFCFLMMSC